MNRLDNTGHAVLLSVCFMGSLLVTVCGQLQNFGYLLLVIPAASVMSVGLYMFFRSGENEGNKKAMLELQKVFWKVTSFAVLASILPYVFRSRPDVGTWFGVVAGGVFVGIVSADMTPEDDKDDGTIPPNAT